VDNESGRNGIGVGVGVGITMGIGLGVGLGVGVYDTVGRGVGRCSITETMARLTTGIE
jgi:hypothetical protein